MNAIVQKALAELHSLPEKDQEELGKAILELAARKKADAKLAEAEARGGRTSHKDFIAELNKKYAR